MNTYRRIFNFSLLCTVILFSSNFTLHAQEKVREFVLLVYLNGSNLESDHQLATQDLHAMINSCTSEADDFAAVLLLGGTKKWHFSEEDIPSDSITYSKITNKGFEKMISFENSSIGDPATLSAFISYSKKAFPANRYGLVFWNHGRGSVYGFGYDELFPDDISLSLVEITEALQKPEPDSTKFAFIGFDACLMASIETANAIAPFADYMIASQELEPGEGWNYKHIFESLSHNPTLETSALTQKITDSYIDFYTDRSYVQTTLSVIALNNLENLNSSIEQLAKRISDRVTVADPHAAQQSFKTLSSYRIKAKSFGIPSFSYAAEDMVDLNSFFKTATLSQDSLLLKAFDNNLKEAVYYHKTSANLAQDEISGLSIYFPYYNKKTARNLDHYYGIPFNPAYQYLIRGFVEELLSEKKDSVFHTISDRKLTADVIMNTNKIYLTLLKEYRKDKFYSYGLDGYEVGLDDSGFITLYASSRNRWDKNWISINGKSVCVFMSESDTLSTTYTVPVYYNNELSDLILRYATHEEDDEMTGKIIGVRKINENGVPDKIKNLEQNAVITFLNPDFEDSMHYIPSETITVNYQAHAEEPDLEVRLSEMPKGKYQVGFCLVDFYGNRHYTRLEDYTIR